MISDAAALLGADLLKLRRRRGLMALSLGLGVGLVAIMFIVLVARHAANPGRYPAAGGLHNFQNATDLLGVVSLVVAAMISSSAGAGDAEAGVLRDLVATGRSRLGLFASRAAAGLWLTLLATALGLLLVDACSVLLAAHLPAPSLAEIAHRDAAVLAFAAAGALFAAAAADVTGSRGPVIATIIVLGLIVSQFLLRVSFLGEVRAVLPMAAFLRLVGDSTDGIRSSIAGSAAVLAGWSVAALGIGGWRTRRAEI